MTSTRRRILALILALMLTAAPALAARSSPTATPNPEPEATLDPNAPEYDPEHPEELSADQLYAWSAILIEAESGKPIFEKNADDIRYPASLTKMMTGLLAIIAFPDGLDFDVTCSETAVAVNDTDDNLSTLHLQAGEVINFYDLVCATLIYSADDGANVIAETVSGSIENFVATMNQAAELYGCTNTHFMNAHGLHDDNHYTTPRDMAIIAREAMSNDTFRQIVAMSSYTFGTSLRRSRTIRSTNELFNPGTETSSNKYYFPDSIGIKTGTTSKAQYCFAGAAERDGVELISVVMYTGKRSRWADTIKLMNYGFSQYVSVTPQELYAMNPITIEVSRYSLNDPNMGRLSLSCVPQDSQAAADAHIIATHDDVENMAATLRTTALIQYTRDFTAPISAGEVMGTMSYFIEGRYEPVVYNLLATRSVRVRENIPKTLEQLAEEVRNEANPYGRVWRMLAPFIAVAALILLVLIWRFVKRLRKRRRRRVRIPSINRLRGH